MFYDQVFYVDRTALEQRRDQISRDSRAIAELFDGKRSVDEVLDASPLSVVLTLAAMRALCHHEILFMVRRRPVRRPRPSTAFRGSRSFSFKRV